MIVLRALAKSPLIVTVIALVAVAAAAVLVTRPTADSPVTKRSLPTPTATTSTPAPDPTPTVFVTPALPRNGADQAERTAGGFALAYAAYSYTDGVTALRDRCRPYVTDAFDAGLAAGGGAGTTLATQHAVIRPTVDSIDTTGLAPDGRLIVVAQVVLDTTSDRGHVTNVRVFELWMSQTAAGWRVDQVATS